MPATIFPFEKDYMADLELLPRSWPAWNFDVAQGGAFVAEILCPYSWKEKGTLKIGEASYEVYREHFMGGRFLLEERGQIIAFAQKPSALRNSFEVHYAGREYRLDKAALMGRKFIFCEETRQLGFIEPRGIFTRKATISLPEELPLPIRTFIIWLVLILWKRESDSGAVTVAVSG